MRLGSTDRRAASRPSSRFRNGRVHFTQVGARVDRWGDDDWESMPKPRPAPSELLELLSSGRVPLDVYLVTKVAQAIAPYRDQLRPRDLTFLRMVLEQELDSDPVLEELKARLVKALRKRSRRT